MCNCGICDFKWSVMSQEKKIFFDEKNNFPDRNIYMSKDFFSRKF